MWFLLEFSVYFRSVSLTPCTFECVFGRKASSSSFPHPTNPVLKSYTRERNAPKSEIKNIQQFSHQKRVYQYQNTHFENYAAKHFELVVFGVLRECVCAPKPKNRTKFYVRRILMEPISSIKLEYNEHLVNGAHTHHLQLLIWFIS